MIWIIKSVLIQATKYFDLDSISEALQQYLSCKDLQKLLTENHRFVFTLIHKFRDETKTISKRENVIVIVDEDHITQYDYLAININNLINLKDITLQTFKTNENYLTDTLQAKKFIDDNLIIQISNSWFFQ